MTGWAMPAMNRLQAMMNYAGYVDCAALRLEAQAAGLRDGVLPPPLMGLALTKACSWPS